MSGTVFRPSPPPADELPATDPAVLVPVRAAVRFAVAAGETGTRSGTVVLLADGVAIEPR